MDVGDSVLIENQNKMVPAKVEYTSVQTDEGIYLGVLKNTSILFSPSRSWYFLAHLAMPKRVYMIMICRCRWCCCWCCRWRLCLWTLHPLIFKMAAYDTIVSIWRQLQETCPTVVTSCEHFKMVVIL